MPTLPTYQVRSVEVGGIGGRRASAEDFNSAAGLIQAGRTVQGAATELMTEFEQQESRKALVESTAIRAKYNRRLDEAAISGEDTDKIKEQMLNELSSVGSDFQTKKGAESLQLYTSNNEINFDQEASRIKIVRAGAEAKLQGSKFINDAGANVQRDPTRLKQEEAAAEALAETFQKLPKEQRALIADGLKKDLNMAAAMALVRDQPTETKKRLEGGEFDLTPEQRRSALSSADHFESVKREAENREKVRIKEEQRDAADTARTGYTQRILQGESGRKLEQQIITDPAFAHFPQYMEHLVTFMRADAKARANEEKASDPRVVKDLYSRFIAPEGTPDKLYTTDAVYDALKAGTINMRDANFLIGIGSAAKDENGRSFSRRLGTQLNSFEQALRNDPRTKALDAAQVAAVNMNITAAAEARAAELRRGADGEKPRSPDGMFDPKSKDFFFTPQRLRDTVEAVKKQSKDAALAGLVDLRKTPDAWEEAEVGVPFIDPKGVTRTMTKELKVALEKQAKAGPTAFNPSGEQWPHDVPMPLSTYRYRQAMKLPINKGLTVIDENGRRVPDSEL